MRQSRSNADPVEQLPTASLATVLTVAASLSVAPLVLLVVASYPALFGVVVTLLAVVLH